MKKYISLFVKGLIIGAAMLIPGVSGGTTAILLGIYDKIISAVSELFSDLKKNLSFLLVVGIGGILGILLFSKAALMITQKFFIISSYFFIGAVIGSLPLMYRYAEIKRLGKLKPSSILWQLFGILLVFIISRLPQSSSSGNIILIVISGFCIAAALILPGISVSYVLLCMGLYDKTLAAVQNMDILFLMPLLLSVAVGTIALTKAIKYAMDNFPHPTFMIISGFCLGSLYEIYPGMPSGYEWIIAPVALMLGAFIIYKLSKVSE